MRTVGLVLLLLAFAHSAAANPPEALPDKPTAYSGVVDAGSTGTRLNIYGFVDGRIKHQGLFTNTPGLANMTNDKEIRTLIRELFVRAEPFYSNIKDIPIGFYGTAGFRTLDKARSEHILELARSELEEYNLKEVKTITGEEEGRLALMALILSRDETTSNESIGVVDMGGKSTQISMLAEDGKIVSESVDLGIVTINEDVANCQVEKTEKQELCAKNISMKLASLEKRPILNQIKNLYLLSYFHDEFRKFVENGKTNMKDVKDEFYKKCNLLKTSGCRNMFYLILFIKNLGIEDGKVVYHVDTNNGINITWASGKGYELNKRYN